MNITIPIYIEQQPQQNQSPIYLVRPLFLDEPVARDEDLHRAVAKFVRASRKTLNKMGKQMLQTGIADYTFAPDVEEHLLKLSLNLKERTANCKFLFITFNALNRRIAFTPSVNHLWFEIGRGETLLDRATEVLIEYFRSRDKQNIRYIPLPEEIMLQGEAQTGLVELKIDPPLLGKTLREDFRARLFGDGDMDGELELQSVGRCLNELYPDDLNRATGRDTEVNELARLLKAQDFRPVLLVGPPMSGKTAIIHEYVYRRTAKRKSVFNNRGNVWLLAPPRLIAGMSFVGQWENRLLAIIKEAKKRKHIVYFDDLLGLFKAGISAQSKLTVAHVLKSHIERREIRVLGEITPEAWRVLREQDRGFADLFHLMPIKESSEDETMTMMLGLIRELEAKHLCRFGLEALPSVLDLARRYIRESAFPGKAAVLLHQLAVKYRGASITRHQVLEEFHAKNGLSMSFLYDSNLLRDDVTSRLKETVRGQNAAVEACADALLLAKARLNDPNRPLASFLFLGPTGVGKTQCVKSLASYLFSSEERLIRFDMNEFISYDSVARLIGTFDQPEGLLTSAIRRQPFAVVLFDEIEKAHPDVFNMLLQVMGEGRLADAIGRTADFTNAILILTSNLGVREAASDLGFKTTRENEASIYTQAAERFFSPEFFNRLDRIVPFNRLDRATIAEITEMLIWNLFSREGVLRRKIVLRIDQRALERIVDTGFQPQLGARALKREIEKQLAQPIARQLTAAPIASPTIIDILPGPDRLRVEIHTLTNAEMREDSTFDDLLANPQSTIERIDEFLDRIEDTLAELRPEGPISIDAVNLSHQRYFTLSERTRALRHTIGWLAKQLEAASRKTTRLTSTSPRKPQIRETRPYNRLEPRFWKEMFAAEDISAYLREATIISKNDVQPLKEHFSQAIRETAVIEMLASQNDNDLHERCLMMIRSLTQNFDRASRLIAVYEDLFARHFGLETRLVASTRKVNKHNAAWLILTGGNAIQLANIEQGTHLFFKDGKYMNPVQIKVFAIPEDQQPREAIRTQLKRARRWLLNLTGDQAAGVEAAWPLDPVIRIYTEDEVGIPTASIDLRSGLSTPRFPTADTLRTFVASLLALPFELSD